MEDGCASGRVSWRTLFFAGNGCAANANRKGSESEAGVGDMRPQDRSFGFTFGLLCGDVETWTCFRRSQRKALLIRGSSQEHNCAFLDSVGYNCTCGHCWHFLRSNPNPSPHIKLQPARLFQPNPPSSSI